jgi:hypothetical protein
MMGLLRTDAATSARFSVPSCLCGETPEAGSNPNVTKH